jgi:hypothetical protein
MVESGFQDIDARQAGRFSGRGKTKALRLVEGADHEGSSGCKERMQAAAFGGRGLFQAAPLLPTPVLCGKQEMIENPHECHTSNR